MGAFGAGIGRTETAALWATGELWLRVPESLKIVVTGELGQGVSAKDLCLYMIGHLGAEGGLYMSIEFSGPAIDQMSLASRMVIPNMMAEFGAKNAYIAPDEKTFAYLAERLARRISREDPRSLSEGMALQKEAEGAVRSQALYPDADALYAGEHLFDAASIELTVACPHSVDAAKPLSQVKGIHIDQAFIGTCTNGRLEDLAAAAEIVKGKKVARGTRFLVIPASAEIVAEGMQLGYVQTLLEAGAVLGVPGCGPCMGNHMGILAPGEVCLSSANRNFKGRMGQPEAEIYLASPAVVAASAIAGCIADPREV
jgi:3-isopropylmalate/(R)-2-methylmalate dehydratase large subunit